MKGARCKPRPDFIAVVGIVGGFSYARDLQEMPHGANGGFGQLEQVKWQIIGIHHNIKANPRVV
jgi:hypothetical protein